MTLEARVRKPVISYHQMQHWLTRHWLKSSEKKQGSEKKEKEKEVRKRYRDCEVCGDTVLWAEFPSLAYCSHEPGTCAKCYTTWIASEIKRGAWRKIKCPGSECKRVLENYEIQHLITAKEFDQLENLLLRDALSTDSNFRWCQGPGCQSGHVHEGGYEDNIWRCGECGFRVCVFHDNTWHEGETCWEYDYRVSGLKERDEKERQERETDEPARKEQEKERKRERKRERKERKKEKEVRKRQEEEDASLKAVSELTKKCPGTRCGWNIEKTSGCDHMTCSRCRHEFCWICFAPFSGGSGIRTNGNTAHAESCPYHSSRID